MSTRSERFLLTLAWLLLGLRLVSIVLMPLTDTSEPRYAEIARLMATSGDWITPWFSPGTPFWGKPPLSFWAQAGFIQAFGLAEWTSRLPSWLVAAATVWILHALARQTVGRLAAAWASLIYVTCALPYLAAGAVLTDPYLALGTTLAMAGLRLPGWRWRLAGALGLAIGLLAKGPLVLVLAGVPALLTRLIHGPAAWPRLSGRLALGLGGLVAVLVVPWYVLAEWKTPGFLDYFVVGEHVRRFLDPGWSGDLYGTAHQRPYGSIWWHALQATLPWGLVALGALVAALVRPDGRAAMRRALRQADTGYWLIWALVPLAFFTLSGNVLWTYTLPAIAPLAILLGQVAARWSHAEPAPSAGQATAPQRRSDRPTRRDLALAGLATLVPAAALLASLVAWQQPERVKTERPLLRAVQTLAGPDAPLWYVNTLPFSARYYSEGRAMTISLHDAVALYDAQGIPAYLAIAPDDLAQWPANVPVERLPQGDSKRYALVRLPVSPAAVAAAVATRSPQGS